MTPLSQFSFCGFPFLGTLQVNPSVILIDLLESLQPRPSVILNKVKDPTNTGSATAEYGYSPSACAFVGTIRDNSDLAQSAAFHPDFRTYLFFPQMPPSTFVTSALDIHSPNIGSSPQPKGVAGQIQGQRAKSLFRKILRINPSGSRFCQPSQRQMLLTFFEIKILRSMPRNGRDLYFSHKVAALGLLEQESGNSNRSSGLGGFYNGWTEQHFTAKCNLSKILPVCH